MKQLNIVLIPTAEIAVNGLTKRFLTPGFLEFCRIIDMKVRIGILEWEC